MAGAREQAKMADRAAAEVVAGRPSEAGPRDRAAMVVSAGMALLFLRQAVVAEHPLLAEPIAALHRVWQG